MKIIRNPLLPPKNYDAINIMGLLFCRKFTIITPDIVRHEQIHTRQMVELLFVGFYIWYLIEWLIRLPMKGNAYHNLCFEREAYDNMDDEHYLRRRKPYAWMKYYR
ncbi:hypothetical protein HMPREF1870_01683 [Bacteroidales bacterium KA00344]|nr:hypothetical protein HMPREF1870_01683 [Bacteroidales bacterium KA00344]